MGGQADIIPAPGRPAARFVSPPADICYPWRNRNPYPNHEASTNMSTEDRMPEITMNAADLYREEIFTDQRAGTLRQLTPVKSDGSADDSRPVRFVGQAQLLTPMGALPLSFEIEAADLAQALEKFPEAANGAVERAVEELKELRREAASGIVIPEMGGGGFKGPGGTGGAPGGGIQLP
jgi:hypothetical protein